MITSLSFKTCDFSFPLIILIILPYNGVCWFMRLVCCSLNYKMVILFWVVDCQGELKRNDCFHVYGSGHDQTAFFVDRGGFCRGFLLAAWGVYAWRDSGSQACDLVSFVAPPGMEIEPSFQWEFRWCLVLLALFRL